jgi:hypothetical protein
MRVSAFERRGSFMISYSPRQCYYKRRHVAILRCLFSSLRPQSPRITSKPANCSNAAWRSHAKRMFGLRSRGIYFFFTMRVLTDFSDRLLLTNFLLYFSRHPLR